MDARSKLMIDFLITSGFYRDPKEITLETKRSFGNKADPLHALYKAKRNLGHADAMDARQKFVAENTAFYSQLMNLQGV